MSRTTNHESRITSLFVLLLLSGCASIEPAAKLSIPPIAPIRKQTIQLPGKYHRVEKNQTLWRISKIYNLDLEDILKSNNITDPAQIKTGQSIFIPYSSLPEARFSLNSHNSKTKDNPADFIWPAKGTVISKFGDKLNNAVNKGLTIRIKPESDIVAAQSGRVAFTAGQLKGYGKTLILSHNNGIMTVYALLSDILVKSGEFIAQGTPIARSVNGIVHFEIRKGYASQNPYYYLSL